MGKTKRNNPEVSELIGRMGVLKTPRGGPHKIKTAYNRNKAKQEFRRGEDE